MAGDCWQTNSRVVCVCVSQLQLVYRPAGVVDSAVWCSRNSRCTFAVFEAACNHHEEQTKHFAVVPAGVSACLTFSSAIADNVRVGVAGMVGSSSEGFLFCA